MAEESGDLAVTQEITKPNEGNLRRSYMEKAGSSKSRVIVLPRYLRASTGSCHDICKYGRKYESEAKERHPLQKRIRKAAPDNQSSKVRVIVRERKKSSVVKPNRSFISKSSFDIPKAEIIKVSTKSPDGQNVNASSGGQNSVKSETQSGIVKTSAPKLRTSPESKTQLSESPKFKKEEVSSSSEKVKVSLGKDSSKSKETNASSMNDTSMKLPSPIMKPLSSPDRPGGLSGRRNCEINSVKRMEDTEVAVKLTPISWRLPSSRASLCPKPSKVAVKSPGPPLASPRLSSSSKSSTIKVAILNKRKQKCLEGAAETDQSKNELKQADNDSVHEKTLYVINMETENKFMESAQNASCGVESSPCPSSPAPKCIPTSPSSSSLQDEEDEVQSEYTETEEDDDYLPESKCEAIMSVEGEESRQGKHKKDGIVNSEDNDPQAPKLKFKRGKIVEIQSESNIPRRLMFRRGRVVVRNQNLKPSLEEVVLRHQDVKKKIDSQVLFNNVIEQTANKLVEKRKSKVKALVGAFETVISLQDTKPSANVVN